MLNSQRLHQPLAHRTAAQRLNRQDITPGHHPRVMRQPVNVIAQSKAFNHAPKMLQKLFERLVSPAFQRRTVPNE